MTETREKLTINPFRAESEIEDLSQAIKQSVERELGEEIRCIRVYGNRYRCNWWIRDHGGGVSGVSGRITRSKFLRVTLTPDGLVIEDKSG